MNTCRIAIFAAEPSRRQLLRELLLRGEARFDICTADSAARLQDLLAAHPFDLLVTELQIGPWSLVEFLGRVSDSLADALVVGIGPQPEPEELVDCFRAGMTDFVPIDQIRRVLARRVCHGLAHRAENNRITRRIERRHTELLRLAEQDQLTGLFNRRYLDRRIRSESFRDDRRRHMTCIFLDLDHFKSINDRFGHGQGDRVLQAVGKLLRTSCRGGDAAIRWGGEEFVVLRASSDLADGWQFAEKIRRGIAGLSFRAAGNAVAVSASLGVVSFPTRQMGYDRIDLADRAMLLAKQNGRDRICTGAMVKLEQTLSRVLAGPAGSPDGRWAHLIQSLREQLGPTQLTHLTVHSRRVEAIATWIATIMDLPAATVETLRLAGLFHDLGKAVVPESILGQARPLRPAQRGMVARHAEYGADLAARMGLNRNAIEYIRHHHGRYDQQGSGIRGSLGASILAVADALAAMRCSRSYAPARTTAQALAELRQQAGRQFHPAVVDAIVQASSEGLLSPAA